MEEDIAMAAQVIAGADALLITAGAGMGVDSGLPDFRGSEGFWKAYPAYAKLGMNFVQMANPAWFERDPELAWGFYGHRMGLYRKTAPHRGFGLLQKWGRRMSGGVQVFTSNVDGHFQRAGFTAVTEIHGSVHWMQCTRDCGAGLFAADPFEVEVDPETFRAKGTLPACPRCGGLARPNILMFDDDRWDGSRTDGQLTELTQWMGGLDVGTLAVLEFGAGTAIPSVRRFSERAGAVAEARVIRVNPREPEIARPHLSLPMGALAAMEAIDAELREMGN